MQVRVRRRQGKGLAATASPRDDRRHHSTGRRRPHARRESPRDGRHRHPAPPRELNPLRIVLRLTRGRAFQPGGPWRAERQERGRRDGPHRPNSATFETLADKTIYHKNLQPGGLRLRRHGRTPPAGSHAATWNRARNATPVPPGTRVDWRGEGEWKITLDVFRDLGLAFAAAHAGDLHHAGLADRQLRDAAGA